MQKPKTARLRDMFRRYGLNGGAIRSFERACTRSGGLSWWISGSMEIVVSHGSDLSSEHEIPGMSVTPLTREAFITLLQPHDKDTARKFFSGMERGNMEGSAILETIFADTTMIRPISIEIAYRKKERGIFRPGLFLGSIRRMAENGIHLERPWFKEPETLKSKINDSNRSNQETDPEGTGISITIEQPSL